MLKVEQLSYHRNGCQIFSDTSFDVAAGTCMFVKGHNGSGKTTLLRLLAGFLPIQEGSVSISGTNISQNHDFIAQNVDYVGHLNAVKKQLTAWDNLRLWNNLSEPGNSVDLVKNFNDTMIIDDFKNHKLSFCSEGQIRRVALSRLNTSKKRLWLLDEPTVSLDENSADDFVQMVETHCRTGGMAVIATHSDIYIPNIELQLIEMKRPSKQKRSAPIDPFLIGDW